MKIIFLISTINLVLSSYSFYKTIFGDLKKSYRDRAINFEIKFSKIQGFKSETQNLTFLSPNYKCPIKRATIYFKTEYHKPFSPLPPINTFNLEIKGRSKFTTVYKVYNYEFMKFVFTDAGLFLLNEKHKHLANLIWEQCPKFDIDMFKNLDDYQYINRDTHAVLFYGKDEFYIRFKRFQRIYGYREFNFIPETYIIPEENKIFLKKFRRYKLSLRNLYIYKPRKGMVGVGIQFLKNMKYVPNRAILMKYITNPLLLNGRKCDLRLYVLVTSLNPIRIYLYKEGFVKIAVDKYELNLKTLNNMNMHLTNCNLNSRSKKYVYGKTEFSTDGNLWTISTLNKYLADRKVNTALIWERIKDMTIKYFALYAKEVIRYNIKANLYNKHMFMPWGLDVILDSHYNPYILENNECTELGWHHDWAAIISMQMVKDALNLVGLPFIDRLNPNTFPPHNAYQRVNEALCEMTRPSGGFERIFPKLNNINRYKKYFNNQENSMLWRNMRRSKIY